MFIGWDPTYWIFALPALILGLIAQSMVQRRYRKYQQLPNASRITGVDAARRLMRTAGLFLEVEASRGELSDHYDPRSKVLRLSRGVATRPSVASLAIVAHEVGHAEQDAQEYLPMRVRSGLVPVVNFASWLGPILFFVGLLLNLVNLAWLGVVAFAAATVFALVTLPVELNASRRGMRLLDQSGILANQAERQGARKMLNAAALTYVAALTQSISTLLYYIFILGGRGRRRR